MIEGLSINLATVRAQYDMAQAIDACLRHGITAIAVAEVDGDDDHDTTSRACTTETISATTSSMGAEASIVTSATSR